MNEQVRTVARPSVIAYSVEGLPPALMEYLSPFAVNSSDTQSLPSRTRARRLTPIHQRSVVIDISPYDAIEFRGQLFGELSAKGSHEDDIVVEWNQSQGFHINGLVALKPETLQRRTTTLEKVVFAQYGEAENTEITILVYKPDRIRFRGEDASQARLKELLLADISQQEPDETNQATWVPANRTQLDEARAYLDGVDFYQVFRLQPMGIRLSDIAKECDSQAEFLQRMAEVFRFVNIRELWRQRKNPTYTDKLWYLDRDYEKQGDEYQQYLEGNEMVGTYEDFDFSHMNQETQRRIDSFFVEYAAGVYGEELGALHKKGDLHANLHGGNIFPTGEFGDHDTTKGKDFGEDVRHLFFDINVSISSELGVVGLIREMQKKGFLSPHRSLTVAFMENFFDAYLRSRYGEGWLFNEDGLATLTKSRLERSVLTYFQQGTLRALAYALEDTLARHGQSVEHLSYKRETGDEELFSAFLERQVIDAERKIGLAKAKEEPVDDRKEIVYRALGESFYSIGMLKDFVTYVEEYIASNLVLPTGTEVPENLLLTYIRIEAYKLVDFLFTSKEHSLRPRVEQIREELLLQAA